MVDNLFQHVDGRFHALPLTDVLRIHKRKYREPGKNRVWKQLYIGAQSYSARLVLLQAMRTQPRFDLFFLSPGVRDRREEERSREQSQLNCENISMNSSKKNFIIAHLKNPDEKGQGHCDFHFKCIDRAPEAITS